MVTTQRIEAAIGMVRARHMGDVALVAIADALATAVSAADVALSTGSYAHPHAELAALQEVARTHERVAITYDILAVALQRLGETVERN